MDRDSAQICPDSPNSAPSGEWTYQQILRELSADELRFLEHRLAARSDASACARSGVPRSTITHSPNLPLIRRAIVLARRDGVELARERLRRLAGKAVQTLEDVLDSPLARASSKVEAARTVLDRTGLPAQHDVQVSANGETMRGLAQAIRASLPPVGDGDDDELGDSDPDE